MTGPRPTADAPTIVVATCSEARGVDDDAPLLRAALENLGATVVEHDWDDTAIDWAAHHLVVIRSTWDYVSRRHEFVEWTRRVESVTRLANPAEVVRWNTDKHYLAELAAVGVPTVPTTFIEPSSTSPTDPRASGADHDDAVTLLRSSLLPGADSEGFVVKPTISAGSLDTVRYPPPTSDPDALLAAAAHLSSLLRAGRSAMVQPYMSRVDDDGETGLVFFDGRFSHAFRKGPLLSVGNGPVEGLFAPEVIDPRSPTDAELELAGGVLDECRRITGRHLVYARVDLVPGDGGRPVLQELELTEPSFFLGTDPGAAGRAAEAILAASRD